MFLPGSSEPSFSLHRPGSAPPLGLGPLPARGEVNELRTEQLAFSKEEAASLLRSGKLLYVSPSTIKSHVKSVYWKLGVSSRKEAVEQAYARKLI